MKHAILLSLLLVLAACAGPAVQKGSYVSVTYTGHYANGTIFDTNDIAHRAEFPDYPQSKFTPMTVAIGQHRVIAGFENALEGMHEGEYKNVTIKATDAYGGYNPDKAFPVQKTLLYAREAPINRTAVVPLTNITAELRAAPEVGKTFSTENFLYNITAINKTHATIYIVGTRNQTAHFAGLPWDSDLIKTSGTELLYRHHVASGDTFSTTHGPYNATVNSTNVLLTSQLVPGERITTDKGIGVVTKETENTITVDFNSPLAGYDLTFDLYVNAIKDKP